jgi:hypothetical protein
MGKEKEKNVEEKKPEMVAVEPAVSEKSAPDQSALTQLPDKFEPKNPDQPKVDVSSPEKAEVKKVKPPKPVKPAKVKPPKPTKPKTSKVKAPKAPKVKAPKVKTPKVKAPKAPKVKAPKVKALKAPKAKKTKVKVEHFKADLGAGYKVSQRKLSGYAVFITNLAKMSNLDEAVPMLDVLDPKDYEASKAVLEKLFTKAEDVYKINAMKEYREYGKQKFSVLSSSTEAEDKRWVKTTERIDDGVWIGNIKEIVNTCKQSYRSKNRNVEKYHKAGVVVRQYPMKPKNGEQVFLSLFPNRFVKKVSEALKTVGTKDGRNMEDEIVPDIWKWSGVTGMTLLT